MKNVLIPWFAINGTDSYPDHHSKFSNPVEVELHGVKYYTAGYSGNKDLESGAHDYADYEAWLGTQPPVTGIREIRTDAFRRRLTKAERKSIRKYKNGQNPTLADDVDDVQESLRYARSVRLDHPYFIADLQVLVTAEIITSARADDLRVDGLPEEAL